MHNGTIFPKSDLPSSLFFQHYWGPFCIQLPLKGYFIMVVLMTQSTYHGSGSQGWDEDLFEIRFPILWLVLDLWTKTGLHFR